MYKTKKIYLSAIILLFSMSQCVPYDYSISDLSCTQVKFSDLPEEIKSFLYNPEPFKEISPEGYNLGIGTLVCLDSVNYYKYEVVKTIIGPWIDYMKLIDTKNKIRYRIETGTPMPYIILKNKIYFSNTHNYFTTVEDFNEFIFTCYSLKCNILINCYCANYISP